LSLNSCVKEKYLVFQAQISLSLQQNESDRPSKASSKTNFHVKRGSIISTIDNNPFDQERFSPTKNTSFFSNNVDYSTLNTSSIMNDSTRISPSCEKNSVFNETKSSKCSFLSDNIKTSKVLVKEYYDSEKENKIKKSEIPRVRQTLFSKGPIRIKQKTSPNIPSPDIEKQISFGEASLLENEKFKQMLSFLKEKIGEIMVNQLMSLINFSDGNSVLTSLTSNGQQIKTILGSHFKQVVLMIKYIVTHSSDDSNTKTTTNVAKLTSSPNSIPIRPSHRKIKSVGNVQGLPSIPLLTGKI